MNYSQTLKPIVFLFAMAILAMACGKSSKNEAEAENLDQSDKDVFDYVYEDGYKNFEVPSQLISEFNESELQESNYIIKGIIKEGNNKMVYLNEIDIQGINQLDSAAINSKGEFLLKGKYANNKLSFLTIDKKTAPGIPLDLNNNPKIRLTINNKDWLSYELDGDKTNEQLHELYLIYSNHDKRMRDFNQNLSQYDPNQVSDSFKKEVNQKVQLMQSQRVADITKFVQNQPTSSATYFASLFLVQRPPISLLELAYNKLKTDMPGSFFEKELKTVYQAVKPIDVGSEAPEIAMLTPEGKTLKLSDLRGKVILIDFWASWCRPCRVENPKIVKIFNKYKDKGFDIYGVSLDKDKNSWQNAIKADGLTWNHVSDLKGWQNEAAQTYKVSSIPQSVLVDKNGVIIAKDLRAEQLETTLANLFN